MTGFNRASGSQSTTSARELANELGRFAQDLKESAEKLRTELGEMKTARGGIQEELAFTATSFVESTLTELTGEEFDTIAEIAQNVPELSSQGLAFFRKKLTDARDEALQAANEILEGTVNAEDFQNILAEATATSESASAKVDEAEARLEAAQSALQQWEDTSVEDDLVRLDQTITENGGLTLSSDNREYYEPTGIFSKAWKSMTGGSDYRAVRAALEEYGHGENGKDAFADLANFKEKYAEFNGAIEAAGAEFTAATDEHMTAQSQVRQLSGLADEIKTDGQLLDTVQQKVADDLKKSPEFIKAMAAHYEEDFPRNLPLLVAKLGTLTKLEDGTEKKLEAVQANYRKVTDQYEKLSRLRPNTKIKGDLEKIKKRNQASAKEYDRYTRSAGRSWRRTRDYDYDRTVYVDNSPSLLETMILIELLSPDDHHHYGTDTSNFVADADSSFTASLMGVDEEVAGEIGLPGEVFEIDEELAAEMSDLGIDDYAAGDMTFDIENPDAGDDFGASSGAGDTFEIQEDDAPVADEPSFDEPSIAGDTFTIDEDAADTSFDDSPSFGGPSLNS